MLGIFFFELVFCRWLIVVLALQKNAVIIWPLYCNPACMDHCIIPGSTTIPLLVDSIGHMILWHLFNIALCGPLYSIPLYHWILFTNSLSEVTRTCYFHFFSSTFLFQKHCLCQSSFSHTKRSLLLVKFKF